MRDFKFIMSVATMPRYLKVFPPLLDLGVSVHENTENRKPKISVANTSFLIVLFQYLGSCHRSCCESVISANLKACVTAKWTEGHIFG